MRKNTEGIKLDATTNAYLLNRYLAFSHFKKFNKRGRIVEEKKKYTIQWANIKSDFFNLFRSPQILVPRIALSLAAFYFIFKGKHEQAIQLSFFTGAIAADASASSNAGTSTLTFAHTVGAALSNSMLAVGASVQDSNHANIPITGITYAAASLTPVRQDTSAVNNVSAALQYLFAPASGANNVVVTCTGVVWKAATASSWSGVAQSGQPDAQAGKGTADQSSASPSINITTVAANSLIIDVLSSEAARTGLGAGQTSLGIQQGQTFENLSCSYIIKAVAGLQAMSATISSSQNYNMIAVSFAPASGSSQSPSSSTSPSASRSPSSSASASRSPSSSTSPSASASPSSSASPSISPSASASPSASRSPSSSASASISPSASRSPSGSSSPSASASPSVEYVEIEPTNKAFKQPRFVFTIEQNDGTFLDETDEWSFDSIVREVNGSMEVRGLKTNQLSDDIGNGITNLFNAVTIRVATGVTGPAGIDYFSGYIAKRILNLRAGDDSVALQVLGHASRLFEMFYIATSTSKSVFDWTAGQATSVIVTDIIAKARLLDTNYRVNSASGSIVASGDTVKDIFELATCGEALNRCIYLAYTAGQIWFWRVLGDNIFTFKKSSTTADHRFTYGKDVLEFPDLSEDLQQAKNEIYVAYAENASLKRVIDATSISNYGNRAQFVRASNVPDATTATAIANAYLQTYAPPLRTVRVTITNEYERGIEYINPGDTCEIINLPTDIQNILTSNMFITKTTYYKDRVELELSIKNPQIASSIQKIQDQFAETQVAGIPTTYS